MYDYLNTMTIKQVTLFIICILATSVDSSVAQSNAKADFIIYGGSSAAVIAAVQAKRMGHYFGTLWSAYFKTFWFFQHPTHPLIKLASQLEYCKM